MSNKYDKHITHSTCTAIITSITFGGRLYVLDEDYLVPKPVSSKEQSEVTEEQKREQLANAERLEENLSVQIANSMKYNHLELITVVGILERVKSKILNY